jgi:hypothetical protein
LVGAVAGCSSDDARRGADGRITESGQLSVFDMQPGDCLVLDDELEATNESLMAVPCDEPHQAEVYALVDAEEFDAYPGERELSTWAELECLALFAGYVGVPLADSTLFPTNMIPSVRGWQDADDRTVVCIALSAGGPLEQSVRASGI